MSQLLRTTSSILFAAATGAVSPEALAFTPPVGEQIAAQTRRCLTLPAAASRGSYRVELAVRFESGVAGDIRVAEVDPPGRTGQSVADAATRAILRCGPFPAVEDGEITLVFESEE